MKIYNIIINLPKDSFFKDKGQIITPRSFDLKLLKDRKSTKGALHVNPQNARYEHHYMYYLVLFTHAHTFCV